MNLNLSPVSEQLGPYRSRAVLENWSPYVEAVREVKNGWEDEKALGLALVLENTAREFEKSKHTGILNETTQTGDVGAFKKFYFDIITAVLPNLIAQDVVSVQPLAQKVGQIFYLKYIYGSTKGSINAGTVMNDPLTGAYNGAGALQYSSEVIDSEVIGAAGGTTYTGNLAYVPVRPGTVDIEIGGVHITDNGSGVLSSTQGGFMGGGAKTINYATGAFAVSLGASAGDALTVTYEYNNEFAPSQVPEVNIHVAEQTITARSRKLKALYAMDAAYDLRMQHGIDIDDTMLQAVSAEIMHELDGEILNDLWNQAALTSTWERTPPDPSVAWQNHRETLIDEIIGAGNQIFSATQRASGNFLIVGVGVSTIIEGIGAPRFVAAPGNAVGPHFLGTIDGKWRVYKNPYYASNSYLVGYKGDLFLDAGYVLAPYLPIFATQLLMLDDFMGRRGFATSNGKKMLNSNLYVKGTMTHTP